MMESTRQRLIEKKKVELVAQLDAYRVKWHAPGEQMREIKLLLEKALEVAYTAAGGSEEEWEAMER